MPSVATKKTAWARNSLVVVLCAASVAIVVVVGAVVAQGTERAVLVRIGSGSLRAAAAFTPEQQKRGLSGVTQLAQGSGMLFVFKNSGGRSFWMKDMRVAIDIVWLNADRRVIKIDKNVTPGTYPQKFSAGEATRYVLEIASGNADQLGITEGTIAEFAVQ